MGVPRAVSDRVNDGTSHPAKLEDVIGADNEDGGGGFDVSKKLTLEEVRALLATVLGTLSGTVDTVMMFTPDGSTGGDSPITIDSGNVQILAGNFSLGTAADANTAMYIIGSQDSMFFLRGNNTSGSDVKAMDVRSQGIHAGANTGGRFSGGNSTKINIGVHGYAAAGVGSPTTDPETDGFDAVGGVVRVRAVSGAQVVAALYATAEGDSSVTMTGMHVQSENDGSGDSVGIDIKTASVGGAAYILKVDGGNIGEVLQVSTADGKMELVDMPSEFSDALFRILDDGDNTKEIAFQASAITTATVRTITMPDQDVDLGAIEKSTLVGREQLTGTIITPPALTANVENYNPTDFDICAMTRIEGDANNRCVGGAPAPPVGENRIIHYNNINTSGFDIKFFHESAGSTAANRFLMRDEADKVIKPNETASFWYDHTSLRWRPFNRIG